MMIYDDFLGSHQVILGHCPYFASRVRTDTRHPGATMLFGSMRIPSPERHEGPGIGS